MRVLTGLTPELQRETAAWVAHALPHNPRTADGAPIADPAAHALAVIDEPADGSAPRVVAGVVYSAWDPYHGTIAMGAHSVTPQWAQPEVLLVVFGFPFDQLGVQRINLMLRKPSSLPRRERKTAQRVRRFVINLGFKEEGSHPRAFGEDGDGLSYGLLREGWPPLKARLEGLAARRAAVRRSEAA